MKYILSFIFTLLFSNFIFSDEIIKNDLSGQYKMAPMKILLAVIPDTDEQLGEIVNLLAKTLSFSGQFEVSVENFNSVKNKKEITDLFNAGYSLIIFFNHSEDKKSIEWRLYDATEAIMIKGVKMHKRGDLKRGYAYNLADDIWQELTKQKSSFSSKIAFIKRKEIIGAKQTSVICVCDFDGSNQFEFINTPGTYLGLYWDLNPEKHRFYCSEFTKYNVRLVSFNINKNKKVIFNFKGTCVGISLSNDYNRAIYCRSGDIWEFIFNSQSNSAEHKKLIKNDGKNIYPILLDNSDVIFCSDSKKLTRNLKKSKGPQICYYNSKDKSIELITEDGYCIAPSYCKLNNKIAYSKQVDGVYQIFIYDLTNRAHKQVTFDNYNKMDSCWSPCGNYIVFCSQLGKLSKIAVFNLKLKKTYYLTTDKDYCICPSWSSLYRNFPNLI